MTTGFPGSMNNKKSIIKRIPIKANNKISIVKTNNRSSNEIC